MVAQAQQTIDITRGQTAPLTATFSQLGDGGLTGCAITFTAKYKYEDASAVIRKTTNDFTVTNLGNKTTPGVAVFTLEPEDTASLPAYASKLVWDLWVVEPDGTAHPAAKGTLTVEPNAGP